MLEGARRTKEPSVLSRVSPSTKQLTVAASRICIQMAGLGEGPVAKQFGSAKLISEF